ncbi:MAG: hypothetical protein WAW84_04510 [Candidatus Rickettsiella isopodorum]
MTKENQDDDFVILQEGEITKLKHEALNHIRFGNDSLDKQFKRDIEFISLAILDYGLSEQDKLKADRLLKSMLLLLFGRICYRHSSDQCFYSFDTLNDYFKNNTTLTHFPIAAILLHGSRVLIEFPSELAHQIMDWLIIDKNNWRCAATHGISVLTEAEKIDNNDNTTNPFIYKCLKEEKITTGQAVYNSVTGLMTACSEFSTPVARTQDKLDMAGHYGMNLALGGVGNQHFASKKMIQNNGEHGHLYINFYQGGTQKSSGLLLGIEQSAPGKPDQYGGEHDLRVSNKSYSASGGDFFCKKPTLLEIYQKDYRGLSVLPFDNYYDNLWNLITEDTFTLIKTSFEKCKCLFSLLSKEKSLAFIKHILSSSGGVKQQDFDQLFDCYFQAIPQFKVQINQKDSVIEGLETRHEQLLALCHEKQQVEEKTITQLHRLEGQIKSLEYEKETIKQVSKKELTQLQQQLIGIQKEKNALLFDLAKCFMQTVIQHMGWRANKSQKQTIMSSLQQLNAKERQLEISSDHIKNLLKNFIGVSLMNRYGLNNGQTRSARACLNYLSLPEYHPLSTLLFLNTNKIDYDDLLTLIAGAEVKNKPIFISARYKKNLYRFYQEEGSRENQFDENQLMLATQQVMYTL